MYFDTFGPFYVQVNSDNEITGAQKSFWQQVREKEKYYDWEEKEIENARGVYVFGMEWGGNLKPWYVGQTVAKSGFYGEIFQKHKTDTYNEVINTKNGKPIMFLFPLLTREKLVSKDYSDSTKSLVTWVEQMLFGLAIKKNPDCKNIRDTKYLRNVRVNGVFGDPELGRPDAMVKDARRLLIDE